MAESRYEVVPVGWVKSPLTEMARAPRQADEGAPPAWLVFEAAIGEGLETVLSAMQLNFSPAWAVGDANNMRSFPVLSGIGCLTIIVDNDESGTGQRAALECSSRWTSAGREVYRIVPNRCGEDINDVVKRIVI